MSIMILAFALLLIVLILILASSGLIFAIGYFLKIIVNLYYILLPMEQCLEKSDSRYKRVDDFLQPFAIFDKYEKPLNIVVAVQSEDLYGEPSDVVLELYENISDPLSGLRYEYRGCLVDISSDEWIYICDWYRSRFYIYQSPALVFAQPKPHPAWP